MSVVYAVTRVACETGGGNQDIPLLGLGGRVPVALFFTVTRATSDGTPADHAILSIGAATATDERWAMGCQSEDGSASVDSDRIGMSDQCIMILTAGSLTIDGEADFVSAGVDTCRINWTNAPASGYLLTVEAWAGSDVTAKAILFSIGANEDDTVNVETVGFEADFLLTGCPAREFNDTGDTGSYFSHGVVTNKAPIVQICNMMLDNNAATEGDPRGHITASYGIGQLTSGGGVLWAGEFSDFDALGFSCTTRLGAGGTDQVGVLAISFGGIADVWAGIIDSPTATGNQSQTGPGFTPQGFHVGLTQMPAIDTDYADANAGSYGIAVFDGVRAYCNSTQTEDNSATTDTQSLSSAVVIDFPLDTGVAAHVAGSVVFTSTGWTWNFSDTEGTAKKWWALAFERNRRVFVTQA